MIGNLMLTIKNCDVEELKQPIRTFALHVPTEWLDYNGHMNESRYLECFSESSDSLLVMAGFDDEYLNDVGSYFSVETHIRHLEEVVVDESLYVTIQILGMEGKKLHVFQRLFHVGGKLIATGEQMMVHVNNGTRQSCEPQEPLKGNLKKVMQYHVDLPKPDGAGRFVGQAL
jgi:carnitine 3-dehydrogenase